MNAVSTPSEINVFRVWMKNATVDEINELATRAEVSVTYLYMLASGKRQASADVAARIEAAACFIREVQGAAVPVLDRGDLCQACADCPYFQKCEKG